MYLNRNVQRIRILNRVLALTYATGRGHESHRRVSIALRPVTLRSAYLRLAAVIPDGTLDLGPWTMLYPRPTHI